MEERIQTLLDRLDRTHHLSVEEYEEILTGVSNEQMAYAAGLAAAVRKKIYGNEVFVRGLIEISNYCKNDCLYCGIRCSNEHCDRYRLTKEEILACCLEGYGLGFRTFVLQSGEGAYPVEEICEMVKEIKKRYPDCAVTLSLGEYEYEDYKKMKEAGADRYLLRHETIDEKHYESLHPAFMSWKHRQNCLKDLKKLGYQVGCGFMVGTSGQTTEHLAAELKFLEEFRPDMCGIGPFIPQKDTPFGRCQQGSAEMTIYLLSLMRLILPDLLIPATTALGTVLADGRERGILAGANVVMPNLSPVSERKKYALYDNKICTGEESAQCRGCLQRRMEGIGYQLVIDRGDKRNVPDEFNESGRVY